MSRDNQIFLSYAHAHSAVALTPAKWLRERGFNIWYDEGIRAGESWRDEIAAAIDACTFVVFFVTSASIVSEHCRKEVAYGLERGKSILTVYAEDVDLPGGLKLALSDVQGIRAFELSEIEYRDALFKTLNRLIELHGAKADPSQRPVPVVRSLGHSGHGTFTSLDATAPTIAVLPFSSRSTDPDQALLADGIAEDILNGLSRQKGLRVIARTSSWRFQDRSVDLDEIAGQLGATHIVDGSIRKAGNHIRVTAQLIRAREKIPVWTEQFRGDAEDVFDLMDNITGEILSALEIQLQPSTEIPRTTPRAYEAFLTARQSYYHLDFESARRQAEEAIEIDPSFGAPYAFIAGMEVMKTFFWFSSIGKSLPTIRYFNQMALSLDDSNMLAQSVDHTLKFFVDREYASTIAGILTLLEDHADNYELLVSMHPMFLTLRRFGTSVRIQDHLIELDPLSALNHRFRAEALVLDGRFEEAGQTLTHAARLGMPDAMLFGYLAFMSGDLEGMREQVEFTQGNMGPGHLYTAVNTARLLFLEENYEGAREVLGPLRQMAKAEKFYYLTALTAQLGNEKEAFLDDLEEALQIGDFPAFQNYTLGGIWKERYADVAAGDRYQSILAAVGLDDASLARVEVPPLPF